MLDLAEHYDKMFQDACATMLNQQPWCDPWIDDPNDNRFGLILSIRPPAHVVDRIISVQHEFALIEPDQYYYDRGDLHITVIAIVSCLPGFTLENMNMNQYEEVVIRATCGVPKFSIDCCGITAFSGGVMIQGFPSGKQLEQIKEKLRNGFRESGLYCNIDSRYRIATAHSTFLRFRQPLFDVPLMVEKLQTLRHYEFGTFDVDQIELVYSDWYQRRDRTTRLKTFPLG